jgi:hypothetical protein
MVFFDAAPLRVVSSKTTKTKPLIIHSYLFTPFFIAALETKPSSFGVCQTNYLLIISGAAILALSLSLLCLFNSFRAPAPALLISLRVLLNNK